MRFYFVGALAGLLLALPVSVSAQTSFPDRTIRFVVSAPAGGGTDIIARMVGQELNTLWGQPVVVENKTGAAGNLAAQQVARAQPDGYTLFVTFGGVLTINPFLFKELGFDPERDLTPITMLASTPYVMMVNPKVIPSKTVKEFIAYAKAQPGKLNWASTNKGSPDHLAGELFSIMSGVPMHHIPYRGAAPRAAGYPQRQRADRLYGDAVRASARESWVTGGTRDHRLGSLFAVAGSADAVRGRAAGVRDADLVRALGACGHTICCGREDLRGCAVRPSEARCAAEAGRQRLQGPRTRA